VFVVNYFIPEFSRSAVLRDRYSYNAFQPRSTVLVASDPRVSRCKKKRDRTCQCVFICALPVMSIFTKTQQEYRVAYSTIKYFTFSTLDALYGPHAKEIPSC
jgi:hypothetical protein